MKMTLDRDEILQHKSGLSVEFKAGKPTHVPPRMVADAKAIGAKASEEDEAVIEKALAEANAVAREEAERAPKIEECVRMLVKRNRRGDFTAGGRPNLSVIFRETGLTIDAKELEPIWSKVLKDIEE